MKFSEMPYERPDAEALGEYLRASAARLAAAADFTEAESEFREAEERMAAADTMFTLARIRHDMDTLDGFYDGEVAFADEAAPVLEEAVQLWQDALLASPYRKEFERKYSSVLFLNMEIERRAFSPEIIPKMQRENALATEYSKLLASAQIPFEGESLTLAQLAPKKQLADDSRRHAAWRAEARWYSEHGEKLDSIYAELTQLRDAMGKKLGYGGYTPLGYYRMGRNCYTREDVERFREAVVSYIVPIAEGIYRRQAKRMGLPYPLSYEDTAPQFRSGDPKPRGTDADTLEAGRKFYTELSGETAEFIDLMLSDGLIDYASRKGKAGGGYCTCLPAFKVPFIFANFNGTRDDVETMTHECGHAFENYLARDLVPTESQWPTMEACEVHSMSMEFFAWPWAEDFFGSDAEKFKFAHLSGALTFIPYGTMVDHFQHIVYDRPDMTPAERNAEWARLTGIYLPWIRLDSLPFYGEGRAWQRQHHIYENPFYYIDYCLAQTVALQFWADIQIDRAAAWEKYLAYTRPAGTLTFTELLRAANLPSPFESGTLKALAEAAEKWLRDCKEPE